MSLIPIMTKEQLRAARKELGWTQEQAAKEYGVSVRTYKYWELSDNNIPVMAIKLTKYFLRDHRSLKEKS